MKPLHWNLVWRTGGAIGVYVVLGASALGQQGAGSVAGSNDPAVTGQEAHADRAFLIRVAQENRAEIQLGQLARSKGANLRIKNFGETLVEDHTRANDLLAQVVKQKGITLPQGVGSSSRAAIARLSRLSGGAFDRGFAKTDAQRQKMIMAMYQKEAGTGYDDVIKGYANQVLPILQTHAPIVQDLTRFGGGDQHALSGTSSTGTSSSGTTNRNHRGTNGSGASNQSGGQ